MVQILGWFLLIYLVYAQGITAFGYDIGVAMGTQEPVENITEVGAAFWYGFAFGDLLVYIPILLIGLVGHFRQKDWGRLHGDCPGNHGVLACRMPGGLVRCQGRPWMEYRQRKPYWIVLLLIAAWGLWGLATLLRYPLQNGFSDGKNSAGP